MAFTSTTDNVGLRAMSFASVKEELGQSRGSLLMTLVAILLLLGLSLYALFLAGSAHTSDISAAYIALAAEGAVFAILVLAKYGRSGIYMFEPFTIVVLVMVLVYFVAPVFQFAAGSTSRYGVDVVRYCVPASCLVMIGCFAFFLGYEFPLGKERSKKAKCSTIGFQEVSDVLASRFVHWCGWIWVIAYVLNFYYYLRKGFDVVYILTGGLSGAELNDFASDDGLAFLAYSKFLLLGAWMIIYAFGRNRGVKVVLYAMTLLCMFLGGGRATLLIGMLAPIVLYFARNRISPKGGSVAAASIALVALFAFMQVARVGLRTGAGIYVSGMTIDEFLNPFYAEIDDFKAFYMLLGIVPSKHDYLFGSQMIFYSLVLLIPRALFPAKPSPAVHEIVGLGFGGQAVVNGVAYPSLGEYYIEFGVVGVVVCMWLFGIIGRHLKNCYLFTEGKSMAVLAYSIVYPALFSFVIRGYMPQNFSMILFLLLPIALCRLMQGAESKKRNSSVQAGNAKTVVHGRRI